jgi:hypothetical protein
MITVAVQMYTENLVIIKKQMKIIKDVRKTKNYSNFSVYKLPLLS